MRFESVKKLLVEVKEIIEILEHEYCVAIEKEENLKISEAKAFAAHAFLRTVMDYVAKDTYEGLRLLYPEHNILKKEVKKFDIKFPIYNSGKDYRRQTNMIFTYWDDLLPEISKLFESVQPLKIKPFGSIG
jgi:hypothetical protein